MAGLGFVIVLLSVSVPIYQTFDWKGTVVEGIVLIALGGTSKLIQKGKAADNQPPNP